MLTATAASGAWDAKVMGLIRFTEILLSGGRYGDKKLSSPRQNEHFELPGAEIIFVDQL
jgi:hypothetical protein